MKNSLIGFCLILTLLVSVSSCAQSKLELIATPSKETVEIGEEFTVTLSLKGIESDIFNEEPVQQKGFLENIIKKDKCFQTSVEYTLNTLGLNVIKPFKIVLLGQELISNSVSVIVEDHHLENLYIDIPKVCEKGKMIQLKLTCKSVSHVSLDLIDDDTLFRRIGTSISTSIINGKTSNITTISLIPLKEGVFELNRSTFQELPEFIMVEPVKFTVN
jgi:hypothetical protein